MLRAWFVGEGSLLVRCADAFLARGHVVAGTASTDSTVRDWAETQNVPAVAIDDQLAARLNVAPFDYLFSVVNLSKFGDDVLAAPTRAAINFHDGPLPAYAGLNTPVWALLAGERRYGVTWHEMTSAIDAGRILVQQFFDVPDDETAFGLNARCYEAGLQSFVTLIEGLADGRLTPTGQDAQPVKLYRRHERPAGHLVTDFSRPAADIAREVRASDFGPYPNPFGVARLVSGSRACAVLGASAEPGAPSPGPGVVAAIDDDSLTIGTAQGLLKITSLRQLTGEPITTRAFAGELGLRVGETLPAPSPRPTETDLDRAVRGESAWLEQLDGLELLPVPYAGDSASEMSSASRAAGDVPEAFLREVRTPSDGDAEADEGTARARIAASIAAFLARLSGLRHAKVALAVTPPPARGLPLLSDRVPVTIDVEQSWRDALDTAVRSRQDVEASGTFFVDLCLRHPERQGLKEFAAWRTHIVLDPDGVVPAGHSDARLVVRVSTDARTVTLESSGGLLRDEALRRLLDHWSTFAAAAAGSSGAALEALTLVDTQTRRTLIEGWNETAVAYEPACVHELIERQVAATPDATAVMCAGLRLTYRELDARANRLARYLQALGIGREGRVGICLERSVDLVVSLLAVLKAGAAYVPLDPHYPEDRLTLVSEDAALDAVLVEPDRRSAFGRVANVVCLADARPSIDALESSPPGPTAQPDDLAYLIYTSGSTGTPKGVMVEHRQVANFLTGMDACVPHERPGTWLSVTSISFDISVLELFWTLARGFTVVLYAGEAGTSLPSTASTRPEPIDFSLFYFSADEGQDATAKYRLLLEGARFADTHGFSAVWTPERHFHAFGGLYPNPAVTGAAVAAITSRVGIRAGSCVLPLHHPFRVAEEWSVVDNISNGRVGIAFASGWQPNDFVLRPENYQKRKDALFESLETVRALWRGEARPVTTPRGDEVALRTLPRPVQPELPTWITAAGNPETFAAAGQAGAGILTHLLGQTFDELGRKVAAYREAWRQAGHAGDGHVVLMLHTLVGPDETKVRDLVREPLKAYLRTSIDLVKPFAESFPTFAARGGNPSEIFASLSEADYEALVDYSFERYYQTSGLFGRPETCLATVDKARAIGIDEIACLIDFGVATDIVLEHLPYLHALLERASGRPSADDGSIAGLIAKHEVTHLQCTPSMARMLLADQMARRSLQRLRAMFVGGEALPAGLAADLLSALPSDAQLWNMYGPTETTVWSTVDRVTAPVDVVTIGRPIANTQIYILGSDLQPVPVGLPGGLFIGGDGVARGYWQRPELTAERFLPDPFRGGSARMYATGDVARYLDDGRIEFLGRGDQQVKIRGHRIELGEIDAAIGELPNVREVVTVVREDREGDKRLVAYVVPAPDASRDGQAVRTALGARLPDFLVPSHVVFLDRLPLTPNGKIDRKVLPAPDEHRLAAGPAVALTTEMEQLVGGIWREVLGTGAVGADDNFFDIGGDSLLAAQVLGALRSRLSDPVSLTDLFRFPTIRQLAAHLGGQGGDHVVSASIERARARQAALEQRRGRPRLPRA